MKQDDNVTIIEGDLVVFKLGLYKDEDGAIYQVVEVNGDRCFLELVNTDLTIRPQSVAVLSELDLYKKNTP